jgi:hypothetical protein
MPGAIAFLNGWYGLLKEFLREQLFEIAGVSKEYSNAVEVLIAGA